MAEGFFVVIPARYQSTRLPGKPLADIAGKPMVVRVAERAARAGAQEVIVATDDERIRAAVEAAGYPAAMTRSDHVSGSDRVMEVAELRAWADDAIVVNVQGNPRIDWAIGRMKWGLEWGVLIKYWLLHTILVCFLIVASFSDLAHMEIPLPVTVCGMLVGILVSVLFPWPWPSQLPLPPPPPPGGGCPTPPRPNTSSRRARSGRRRRPPLEGRG